MNNHRIQKFTNNGTFMTSWGGGGSGNGQFQLLLGIDRDSSNNVYAVDQINKNIQKFTSNGTFLKTFDLKNASMLEDIELDSHNKIHVTDRGASQILEFTD
jgi:hypothetical protein